MLPSLPVCDYLPISCPTAIDQWQRTGWETNKNYLIVDNFADGWKYEVRVVASNGGIYETASESEMIFPTAVSSEYAVIYSVSSVSLIHATSRRHCMNRVGGRG